MDSIYESIVSTIDQDYQSKKDMSLSSFTKKELSKSIIDKYKSDYRQLSHIRINKNTKGYVWLDGNSLVGFINVEDKDGERWINSFEIFGKYKKHGLSKQMMNVAMRDLKATHLSVNKKNNVAIKIYKSIGFNTYKETDTMLFMSINESYIEESVKIRNQIGKTEIEDIKTVISSLDDNSFNDFKFKDIVYCDIKYKSKKPIAFITIRIKLINNSTVGYVSLAVNPKYQNQGIGKSLTEKAVSWFKKERGIHFLEWHCLQDNEASKKLANYAGFREYIAKGQEEYIHFTMESSNNESYIEESKKDSEYSYSSLSSSKDIADFNKNMQIVFRSKNDMSKEKTHKSMKAIKFNGEIIGYIGFSHYNIDGKKYLGIGNFMIIPRYQSSGHGTKIIKDLIDRYKDTYDEIYCYVEKENTKAIQFYKRIADVNTKNLTKYGYYVCLYRKGGSSTNESYIEEEIENEFSPTSFVKRSSLPAKNQKNHTRYLRKKAHSNKTNNATAQNELPKYNQIGELYVEEVAKSVQVKPIFIVISYTNTPFGKAIKTFTHSEYTHAAISFDTSLEKLYSFNADSKYSNNGYKGGISRESLSSYIDSYEKTIIQVNCIFLKPSDFDIVQRALDNLLENEEKTKYAYSNIINILIGRAKDTGMAMVCSQFVAYILHTANIELLDKPDNTVTPKDLSTITNPRVYKIFEGYAKDYEKKRIDRIFRKLKTKALLIKESLLKLCV